MPLEGISAREHGLTHSANVEDFMRRTSHAEGYPMEVPDHVPHTRNAIVMAEVARDAGAQVHERAHRATFGAYFGRGRDIGHREVLLDIAEAAGLDVEPVVEAWLADTYADRLEGFAHVAGALGIGEIPAVLVCNHLVIGVRPYKVFEELLQDCLASPEAAEASAAGVASAGVVKTVEPTAGEPLASPVAEPRESGHND